MVVGGSLQKPEIVARDIIEILGDAERFCFHMAAEMKPPEASEWFARTRDKALANASRALAPFLTNEVVACAIVAREGKVGDLVQVLASHSRIHSAEGSFYRDLLRDACPIPVHIVPPSSLDVSKVGKLMPPPWGKDQKLAALAAWKAIC